MGSLISTEILGYGPPRARSETSFKSAVALGSVQCGPRTNGQRVGDAGVNTELLDAQPETATRDSGGPGLRGLLLGAEEEGTSGGVGVCPCELGCLQLRDFAFLGGVV